MRRMGDVFRAFEVAERGKLEGNFALQRPKCARMGDVFRAFGTHLFATLQEMRKASSEPVYHGRMAR